VKIVPPLVEIRVVKEHWEQNVKPDLKVFLKKFGRSGLTTIKQFITEGNALITKHFDPLIAFEKVIGELIDKSNLVDKIIIKLSDQLRDWLIELIDELLVEIDKEEEENKA